MKTKLLICFLFVTVSLSNLKGQTISAKDLVGFWRLTSDDPKMKAFARYYTFYDDSTYKLSTDSLGVGFTLKGTYSLKLIQGETILETKLTLMATTNTYTEMIRRSSPNSFIMQTIYFTKSGELKWKWNNTIKSLNNELHRIDVKEINTKTI